MGVGDIIRTKNGMIKVIDVVGEESEDGVLIGYTLERLEQEYSVIRDKLMDVIKSLEVPQLTSKDIRKEYLLYLFDEIRRRDIEIKNSKINYLDMNQKTHIR